ncbi:MAG: hypothetical protein AAFP92_01785 [Bacteroidota bacterium]
MQPTELSMSALIRHFKGTLSETWQKKMEELKKNDPDFLEEMEIWESFVDSFRCRTEGIERLQDLHQEWYVVMIPKQITNPVEEV